MKKLNHRQHQFALLYDGNGTETCRRAGYNGSDNVLAVQARRLLRNDQIIDIIEQRNKDETAPLIADRETRQLFWSVVMLDPDQEMVIRLKASEILAKSCGDFIAKIEQAQKLIFSDLLNEINFDNDPLVHENEDNKKLKIGG